MRDLGFAMIWVVLLPITFWSAHVGVLLWIWVALLSPNERLYGFMVNVPFNKPVAIITLALVFLNKQKKKFYVDATVVAMLLMAAVGTLAAFFPLLEDDDGMFLYQKLIKEFALAFTIMAVMWDRRRLVWTMWALCIAIGYTSAVEGLEYVTSAGGHQILGSTGIGDNNSVALAVLIIIPFLYYLLTYSPVRITRIAVIALIATSVVTVIGTGSRGGFVGLLILGGALVLRSKHKLPPILLAIMVGAAVLAFAPQAWFDRMHTIEDAGDNGSFITRVVAWKVSTAIALHNPLFGGGFHAVQRYLNWQRFRTEISAFNFIPTPEPEPFPHAAHSIYFEVLGDLGFTGLAAFLGILGAALYNCQAVISRTKKIAELGWATDMARMLQVSIVIYMVSGALLSMAYFEGFWILIALISRLHRTVQDELAARAGPAIDSYLTAQATIRATPEAALARLMPE
jgi:probable O-glycosylation ligase (exosortase A-associated)